jgi:hypothetical protein
MLYPITLEHFGRRTALIDLFRDLNFKVGVEIGTDHGDYARNLCAGIPDLKLYCIDPWVAYTEGNDVKSQQDVEVIYQHAQKKLEPFNCHIIRETSMDALKYFTPNSMDFVFIDGNHEYDHVLEDITAWEKIVRPGGIICGHDYKVDPVNKYGVIEAVQKYTTDNRIWPWFILSAGGRLVDCWMWRKI